MTQWYGPNAFNGIVQGQGGSYQSSTGWVLADRYSPGAQLGQDGQYYVPAPFTYLPPPPPPPPPAPTGWGTGYGGQPPPSGWGTGFTGGTPRAESPFAAITGQQQAYYQLNPDLANNLLRSWLAPNANSPFAGYIDSRMPDLQKQYAVASGEGGNTGLQYTDWLKQNYSQLSNGFANLSQSQRGENPLSFGGGFAGRFTG